MRRTNLSPRTFPVAGRRPSRLAAWAILAASAFTTGAQAQTLRLGGLQGQTVVLTAADVAAFKREEVTVVQHGAPHTFGGVRLGDLLTRVGAPSGAALHGADLADVVVISASDGYRVALALSDLDPGVRRERVIVATERDGVALDAASGPFQLVVEGDLRPVRAARRIETVTLERVAPHEGERPGAAPHVVDVSGPRPR